MPFLKSVSWHKFILRKEVFPMAETGEVYRCDVCGMVVEVKEAGGGELVCCDQPMIKES
jgi:desulfoferrodoxin-like iron-binding protein